MITAGCDVTIYLYCRPARSGKLCNIEFGKEEIWKATRYSQIDCVFCNIYLKTVVCMNMYFIQYQCTKYDIIEVHC